MVIRVWTLLRCCQLCPSASSPSGSSCAKIRRLRSSIAPPLSSPDHHNTRLRGGGAPPFFRGAGAARLDGGASSPIVGSITNKLVGFCDWLFSREHLAMDLGLKGLKA